MKRRNLCRFIGAAETLAWGFLGYRCYHIVENIDYNFLFASDSIEHKIAESAYAGALYLSAPIAALGVVDGISGIAMGACGYFVLKSWQRLSKNPKTREEIEASIKSMREE